MFFLPDISSDSDSTYASFAIQTLQPVVLEYCIYTASSYVLQSFFSAFILSNSQASPMTPPPAFTSFTYFVLFGRFTNLVSTKYL